MSVDMTELYTLLQNLKVTPKNRALAEEINDNIQNGEYELALTKLRSLQNENLEKQIKANEKKLALIEDLRQGIKLAGDFSADSISDIVGTVDNRKNNHLKNSN